MPLLCRGSTSGTELSGQLVTLSDQLNAVSTSVTAVGLLITANNCIVLQTFRDTLFAPDSGETNHGKEAATTAAGNRTRGTH